MPSLVAALSTGLVPLTSLIAFSVYLANHPQSPLDSIVKRPVQLPVHRDESLDDIIEKDAFDLEDPIIWKDGVPVEPEQFWAWTYKLKLAFLITSLLPFADNIALLVTTITSHIGSDDDLTLNIIIPILFVPSQLITILTAWWWLSQNYTAAHWSTTVHLGIHSSIQFFSLALIALLPSTPMPRAQPSISVGMLMLGSGVSNLPKDPVTITKSLLPFLQFVPFVIVLSVRRGPPLHFPLSAIYPAKIVDAIPADARGNDPTKGNVNEEVRCTIPDWLLFSYATPVIKYGAVAESMDVWDLPVLQAKLRALPKFIGIKKIYGKQRKRLGRMEGFNLLLKLAKSNKGALIAQSVLTTVTAIGYYGPHLVLKVFLDYLAGDPARTHPAWGWLLAFSLFVSNATIYICSGLIWSISVTTLQAGIRLELNTLLFTKTLVKKDIASSADTKGSTIKEDGDSKKEEKSEEQEDEEGVSSKSQIMTLFTVDVDRVTEFVFHQFALIDSPLELITATFFLLNLLGTSALYGLLAALLFMPLSHIASKVVVNAQENLMKARDSRTALMNEILQGIRMLKFMAWERSFENRIDNIRTEELHWQARNYLIEVLFNCIWALSPVVVTVVSFLHFTLVAKQELTPAIAFTSIAVFGELRYALSALPETFIEALQGFVSCRRIEKYMTLSEIYLAPPQGTLEDIVLTNATFTWPREDSNEPDKLLSSAPTPKVAFTLADLTLRFPKGKLSLICGRLGSGKSLLLNGLLGEADLVSGQLVGPRSSPELMDSFSGTAKIPADQWVIPEMVAYVPQQAWLQNASIKDNIIFSSPLDEERYTRVIEACSLTTDLEILEDGDQTEIGEKGLNLSGGQKARVSLARAVYSRADTLLLDDVLSAVDAHTAHALMENCLLGEINAGRTILIVSHHTALVSPGAAYIVALENGNVKFAGTRSDFVAGGLMEELDNEDAAKPTEGEVLEEKTIEERGGKAEIKPVNKSLASVTNLTESVLSEPSSETSSISPGDEYTLVNSDAEIKKKTPRKLIEDEQRARGRIAWPVWKTYFAALGGPVWWFFFVLAVVSAQIVPVAENGWLKYWTGGEDKDLKHSTNYYVFGYTLITVAGVFVANFQYAVIYLGSLRASRRLHASMLKSVLFANIRFHDTTSRGRLLNRFGKDIEGLDSSMADNFVRSLSYGLSVIVTISSITWVGGWPFAVATFFILIIYYKTGSIYGETSRDMRRLDSITRSPLYSLFGETVSGVAVIRAFGASTISLKQMMKLADTNLLAFVWSWSVNRWLSARFNVLSSMIIGITAVVTLLTPSVSAAQAGFALAFANTISHSLLFVVRRFVQLEQSMVALERIKEYSELKQEAPEFVEPRPPTEWPQHGEIEVKDLVIRYAPDLPDVLHGLSFHVEPREKIGVVGSTGCGKSTLALSFFRFVEATKGSITIDGIDISKIGLTDLRTRVTIIPQDPTILSGTLRSTLDVFDEYDDADIYAALRRVHLLKDEDLISRPASSVDPSDTETAADNGEEEVVERNVNVFKDLNNPVSEGGDNFSSGEKQLMCMARAILRRNRVLFMDEATASIDYETDELISKTIREEFSDSTILTIAHRIHTIIDFDKVLVMDKGSIAEFASPAELLRDHKSKFYKLCKATGRTEFKNLKELALEAERKRQANA